MKVTDRQNLEAMDQAASTKAVKKRGSASSKSGPSSEKIRDELSSSKVKLSDRAQDMKKIRAAVDSTADVDEAKVAHFKNLISSGDYKVDAKAVADKMVDEHAYNEFLEE